MNRIREIRERRGLSQSQLAAAVGTTQPQINRLETGVRKLTVEWMQKIAQALDVHPEDLITTAVMAGLSEDAEAYIAEDKAISAAALAQRGLAHFRIKSNAVELAGYPAGTVVLIDMTPAAVESVKTGDVVVAQAYDRDELTRATTIVRQFVAPSLLTTNRLGTNSAFSIEDEAFDVAIKGVVIPSA